MRRSLLAGCAVGPDFQRPPRPRSSGTRPATLPADLARRGATAARSTWRSGATCPRRGGSSSTRPRSTTCCARDRRQPDARRRRGDAGASAAGASRGARRVLSAARFRRQHRAPAERSRSVQTGTRASTCVCRAAVNLYSLGPTVSYVPDVFGGTRRHVEQAAALAEQQGYEVAAAYLTLTGNAVAQAINLASARMQLAAAGTIIARRRAEPRPRAADARGRQGRRRRRADRREPARQRSHAGPAAAPAGEHAPATRSRSWSDGVPAEWSPPDFDLDELTLPGELPVTLPSELVRRRPDILAAEAQLHADSAASASPPRRCSRASRCRRRSAPRRSRRVFPGASRPGSRRRGRRARLPRRRARRPAPGGDRRVRGVARDLSRHRAAGVRPGRRRAPRARARRGARRRRAARARRSPATLELQRFSYGAGKANLLQLLDAEGAPSRPGSATRVPAPNATRTRPRCSSPWAAAGGTRASASLAAAFRRRVAETFQLRRRT